MNVHQQKIQQSPLKGKPVFPIPETNASYVEFPCCLVLIEWIKGMGNRESYIEILHK